MNEIQSMLQCSLAAHEHGRPYALATVMKVEGSSYRTPGARMLVCSDGRRIGSISGGCLEADVAEHARQVMESSQTRLVYYDGQSGFDLIMELGCKGSLTILIEPGSPAVCRSLEFLASFETKRGNGAMATVFCVSGETAICVGDRIMRRESEKWEGSLRDTRLVSSLLPSLEKVRDSGRPMVKAIELLDSGMQIEALIEPARSPIALVLFGAGPDGIPMAEMAKLQGWCVTVVDTRASHLATERFPSTVALLDGLTQENPVLDGRTAAIIMSHSYSKDLQWFRAVLSSNVGYIGLLGPRKRAQQMLSDLWEEGLTPWDIDQMRLHSPTGLDLGSETAEGIALSVVAEIQAVMHDRSGGFLRERALGIHEPVSAEHAVEYAGAPQQACMTLA